MSIQRTTHTWQVMHARAHITARAHTHSGTQIVLLEDDFGAIVEGIREGRLIFENLKKCIACVPRLAALIHCCMNGAAA